MHVRTDAQPPPRNQPSHPKTSPTTPKSALPPQIMATPDWSPAVAYHLPCHPKTRGSHQPVPGSFIPAPPLSPDCSGPFLPPPYPTPHHTFILRESCSFQLDAISSTFHPACLCRIALARSRSLLFSPQQICTKRTSTQHKALTRLRCQHGATRVTCRTAILAVSAQSSQPRKQRWKLRRSRRRLPGTRVPPSSSCSCSRARIPPTAGLGMQLRHDTPRRGRILV